MQLACLGVNNNLRSNISGSLWRSGLLVPIYRCIHGHFYFYFYSIFLLLFGLFISLSHARVCLFFIAFFFFYFRYYMLTTKNCDLLMLLSVPQLPICLHSEGPKKTSSRIFGITSLRCSEIIISMFRETGWAIHDLPIYISTSNSVTEFYIPFRLVML